MAQSQGGGHEDRPPARQLALYPKSSAGTAGGERPIKVTLWLGSPPEGGRMAEKGGWAASGVASRALWRPVLLGAHVGAVSMGTGLSSGLLRADSLHVSEFA